MKKRFLLLFAILLATFGGISKYCIAANASKRGRIEKFIAENIRIDIPVMKLSQSTECEFLFRNEKGGFSSEKIDFASLDCASARHFNYYERNSLSGDFVLQNLDIGVPEYKWRYEQKSFGDFSMTTGFYYNSDVVKFRDFSYGGKIVFSVYFGKDGKKIYQKNFFYHADGSPAGFSQCDADYSYRCQFSPSSGEMILFQSQGDYGEGETNAAKILFSHDYKPLCGDFAVFLRRDMNLPSTYAGTVKFDYHADGGFEFVAECNGTKQAGKKVEFVGKEKSIHIFRHDFLSKKELHTLEKTTESERKWCFYSVQDEQAQGSDEWYSCKRREFAPQLFLEEDGFGAKNFVILDEKFCVEKNGSFDIGNKLILPQSLFDDRFFDWSIFDK